MADLIKDIIKKYKTDMWWQESERRDTALQGEKGFWKIMGRSRRDQNLKQ